jgi:hypothetical protein
MQSGDLADFCDATGLGSAAQESRNRRHARFGPIAAAAVGLLGAGAAAAEEPAYLAVDPGACARMVEHVPDPDVTYQPGVDVHGNPVAPADLTPTVELPDVIWIPLELDLQRAFGVPGTRRLFDGRIVLGTVRVEGNHVTYDGQELTDPQAEALAQLCQRSRTP